MRNYSKYFYATYTANNYIHKKLKLFLIPIFLLFSHILFAQINTSKGASVITNENITCSTMEIYVSDGAIVSNIEDFKSNNQIVITYEKSVAAKNNQIHKNKIVSEKKFAQKKSKITHYKTAKPLYKIENHPIEERFKTVSNEVCAGIVLVNLKDYKTFFIYKSEGKNYCISDNINKKMMDFTNPFYTSNSSEGNFARPPPSFV